MRKFQFLIYAFCALFLFSCNKQDSHNDLPVPNPANAERKLATFDVHNEDPYHFTVTLTSSNVLDHTFHFSNGDSSKLPSATVYFPFKGTYEISLTVVTEKGVSKSTKKVKVGMDDPTNPDLIDPVIIMLTGGAQDLDGKTWILDTSPNSAGIGPLQTLTTDYWNFPEGLNSPSYTNGMAQNSFTFNIHQYQYIPKNDWASVHWAHAGPYFGIYQPQFVDIALQDKKHTKAPFVIKNTNSGIGTGYTIDIANGSYLGFFDNRNHYEIISITNDRMYIRHAFSEDPFSNPALDEMAYYFTFIAQ